MKKLITISILLIGLNSCFLKESDVASTPQATCISTAAACTAAGTFESCSDGVKSWYTWKGKKYPCATLSDCTGAATTMTNEIIDFCF